MKVINDIKSRISILESELSSLHASGSNSYLIHKELIKELKYWLPQIEAGYKRVRALDDTLNKEDYDFAKIVVGIWANALNMRMATTDNITRHLKKRKETFSEDEILQAIHNRIAHVATDEWINKPENVKHKNRIDLAIRDDDRLQTELNRQVQTAKEESVPMNQMKFD